MADATVLIVPGLRDESPDHWQTLMTARLPRAVSVKPMGRDNVDLRPRLEAIEAAAAAIRGPLVLIGHSAGCIMIARWALETRRAVIGALLAAPPDLEIPMPAGYPALEALRAGGWFPIPRRKLPFASLVGASRNDPLARFDRVVELAEAWGSALVDLGDVGHLNPASGYGPWPRAEELVAELAASRLGANVATT